MTAYWCQSTCRRADPTLLIFKSAHADCEQRASNEGTALSPDSKRRNTMPFRRLMLLIIVAAAVLAACAGAPAVPVTIPAPAAPATTPTTAPLAQDNLAYAEALRLSAEAGSLAQS